MIGGIKGFYERHERTLTPIFLAVGFLFDVVTLDRIDSWFTITQQAIYILVIAVLVGLEVTERHTVVSVTETHPKLKGLWPYRTALVHFLLGSLLSSYTLFYFKSSSFLSSFVFISLLSVLLIANEYSRFQSFGIGLRVAMFALCLLSYLIYFVPIVMGFIGVFPFCVSVLLSSCLCYVVYRLLRRRIVDTKALGTQVRLPMLLVHLGFALLYFMRILPPVPLSISYMGIYHGVTKENGRYVLTYTRPRWKFWQHGDQSFESRPGDQIYGFASIFSPSGFKDEVYVRWFLKDAKHGWQKQDHIPMQIVGGRDLGFRGYTVKKNFQPGRWRFQIETRDGREVGRLYFTVTEDDTADERDLHTDTF